MCWVDWICCWMKAVDASQMEFGAPFHMNAMPVRCSSHYIPCSPFAVKNLGLIVLIIKHRLSWISKLYNVTKGNWIWKLRLWSRRLLWTVLSWHQVAYLNYFFETGLFKVLSLLCNWIRIETFNSFMTRVGQSTWCTWCYTKNWSTYVYTVSSASSVNPMQC